MRLRVSHIAFSDASTHHLSEGLGISGSVAQLSPGRGRIAGLTGLGGLTCAPASVVRHIRRTIGIGLNDTVKHSNIPATFAAAIPGRPRSQRR